MIETLFYIILTWMNFLVPNVPHGELAWAVAINARSTEEASVITAVAFRESTLQLDAIGDHGRSVCAMQIHDGSRELLTDAIECVHVGAMMLRESRRQDRKFPIAFYARGPNYQRADARQLSNDRMAVAKRLMESVKP
jgi:hypothetical protein